MNRLIASALILAACMVCGSVSWAVQPAASDVRLEVEQLCNQGRLVDATHLAMRHLLDARARYGYTSNVTADYLRIVAEVARRRGKLQLSQTLYERALAIQAATVAVNRTETDPVSEQGRLIDLKQRCGALCTSGDFAGAVHASMKELLRARATYGNRHRYTAQYTAVVGDVAQLRGKLHLASTLYQKAFAMMQEGMRTTVSRN